MCEEEIKRMTEIQFKALVKLRVRNKVFHDLREVQSGHMKVKHIVFSRLKYPQDYLTSELLNNKTRSLLYNLRSKSVRGIKDNFHRQFKGALSCPFLCLKIDSQEHLLCCTTLVSALNNSQKQLLGMVQYVDIFGTVEEQSRAARVFLILMRIRTRLLETSQGPACEGNSTQPDGYNMFCVFYAGKITTTFN